MVEQYAGLSTKFSLIPAITPVHALLANNSQPQTSIKLMEPKPFNGNT